MLNENKQINFGGCFIAGIAIFILAMVTRQPLIAFIAVAVFIFMLKKNKISFESNAKTARVDRNLSKAYEEWMRKRKIQYGPKDKSASNRRSLNRQKPKEQRFDGLQKPEKINPLTEMQAREDKVYVEELEREQENYPVEKQEMAGLEQDWSILPGSTSGNEHTEARISSPTKQMYHGRKARKPAYIRKSRSRAPSCSACRKTVPANARYCMHCGAGFGEKPA